MTKRNRGRPPKSLVSSILETPPPLPSQAELEIRHCEENINEIGNTASEEEILVEEEVHEETLETSMNTKVDTELVNRKLWVDVLSKNRNPGK